jgi:hypothetical protein
LFGKILDLIVLNRYSDCLITSDLQFGFKAKCSTNMCSLVLKECIAYYTSNNSSVYCTMLDATKAFDRVEYCKLFRKLMSRKIPAVIIRLILNIYVNHTTRIAWNGIHSDQFCVRNGVKQGGILSPVLYCLYIDGLIDQLTRSNKGCYMGSFFVGVLAYADDLVLLSPTPRAMRSMLAVCDSYASEFCISFNANKSKCLLIRPRSKSRGDVVHPRFKVGGKIIDFVDKWPHLGHIITDTLSDDADICSRRNSLVGQINNVLCYFGKLEAVTKVKLMKSYCSSFYGCEIWDFWNNSVEHFCKAWRHGQRAVWKLPYNTHRRFLPIICDSIPVLDEICRRFLLFLHRMLIGDCELVKFVIRSSLLNIGMFSYCGRNALYCCERFGFTISDIMHVDFRPNNVRQYCIENRSNDDIQLTNMVLELIFIRDNTFDLDGFCRDEILNIINFLCSA